MARNVRLSNLYWLLVSCLFVYTMSVQYPVQC